MTTRVSLHSMVPFASALLTAALWISASPPAAGYSGEAGSSDGTNPAFDHLQVSTHHTHLTRALAYCAGLPAVTDHRNPVNPLISPEDALLAERIALYDQLTDSGSLSAQGAEEPMWTNSNTLDWSYELPPADAVGCSKDLTMVYPITTPEVWDETFLGEPVSGEGVPGEGDTFFVPGSGAFTHRFGPWVGMFHFPQADGLADDLAVLRAFAVGETKTLLARSLYGFATMPATVWSGSCYEQRIETVPTGAVKPGSAEAFGTYLHSLADGYSHRRCREHWLHRQTPPWYYHTIAPTMQEGCGFDDHGFEFGCPDSPARADFATGTVDGGIAVFNELVGYALANGFKPRVATVDAHDGWLRRQIERYAVLFGAKDSQEAGACRVSFAQSLLQACGAVQSSVGCLPDVDVDDGGRCPAEGRTSGCEEGTDDFPMTPGCKS